MEQQFKTRYVDQKQTNRNVRFSSIENIHKRSLYWKQRKSF